MRDNAFKSLSVCLNHESGGQHRVVYDRAHVQRAPTATADHDPCSTVGLPWLVAQADHLGGNAAAL
jgi:hypothetical protein